MKKTILKATSLLSLGTVMLSTVPVSSVNAQEQVEITFINHKTDWAGDGTWDRYLEEFNAVHPEIKVNIETITDYAGQIKTRMNSDQYGDVLMIPGDISPVDYGTFFEPLGDKAELAKQYVGLNDRSYEGVQYGIPTQMNATGMVVNMQVFRDAGIEEFPKTEEDFIAALEKIKESNPEVTPLYTNYAAGWTLSNFDFVRAGASGNYDFTNEMTTDTEPFAEGKTMYKIYKLLFDVANKGLIEADPTTTDWEQSKVDLANGKIGVMVLGSWAIPQMQAANPDNAANIEFHPFPITAEDGKQYLPVGGDYNYGISIHSKHKEEARIFIDWMLNESNYAADNGGLPSAIDGEYPATLKSIQESGVILLEENPAPEGKESLFSDINNESELGIGSTDIEKQRIIDAAIGNTSETFEEIMAEFNARWADAISAVSGN